MALASFVSLNGSSSALPKDLLVSVFCLLDSHERRVVVPLVCKAWCQAIFPSASTARLWEDVNIRDLDRSSPAARIPKTLREKPNEAMSQADTIRSWFSKRRNFINRITVFLSSSTSAQPVDHSLRPPLASWSRAFGMALPALVPSPELKQLAIHGPGVSTSGANTGGTCPLSFGPECVASVADAAGAVLRGAFALPSLEQLHIYDIPWSAVLAAALTTEAAAPTAPPPGPPPSGLLNALSSLRELSINHCFYSPLSTDDWAVLSGGTAVAWAVLGAALRDLPLLERLDLSYTHAMTYCDPARGVAAAPWPTLRQLRELSLAHDLAVQAPTPAPLLLSAPAASTGATAAMEGTPSLSQAPGPEPASQTEGFMGGDGGEGYAGEGAGDDTVTAAASPAAVSRRAAVADSGVFGEDIEGSSTGLLHEVLVDGGSGGEHPGTDTDELAAADIGAAAEAAEVAALDLEADVSLFGLPLLTIDAAHALVELHSWLPQCSALASLDLRRCGLEAVPLAVTHLPLLTRLDLYGNPLISMRLPGPLRALMWLRFSLDRCYDMLYDMVVADGGDGGVAEEEMWTVELPAPLLEELEVDSCSSRALGLIREAAAGLPLLRRLTLQDNSAEALG